MRQLLLVCFLIAFSVELFAQDDKTPQTITAGFQFSPIFPAAFLKTGDQEVKNDAFSILVSPKFGFSAGMVIRYGFSKRLALETGLNFVQRNYDLSINRDSTAISSPYSSKTDFTIIGYEHPVKLLVFVQLSKKLYMNAAAGLQLTFFPSDIFTSDEGESGTDRYFKHSSLRTGFDGNSRSGGDSFVSSGAIINLGWEYRTKKSGYFYLGATYHVPFTNIYRGTLEYTDETNPIPVETRVQEIKLNGSYLTFDIRYFFQSKPIVKKDKKKKRKKKSSQKDSDKN
ncbi:MAG: outer membrane beta-barrel protein [Flavobacteriales bacterium]|nr:outer membrane beta-barrel protein [Flavobacteriales bacterium]